MGLILGLVDKKLYSPFSAPFGGFSYIVPEIRIQHIEEAIRLLVQWAKERQFLSITLTLPPQFYDFTFVAKQINCLWRKDFKISKVEINHSFNLENFKSDYTDNIRYNARKNLKIANAAGFQLHSCNSIEDKELAFHIISENRRQRGFPLRMTWAQIRETINIVKADFFLLKMNDKEYVASAIVFHVADLIVQVIYWGDVQGYSEVRPMNFLSWKLFEHYSLTGMRIIDIGYSTENSVPNYGLCDFKESIGCQADPKFTFERNL